MLRLILLAACAASSLVGMGASFVLGYGCGACTRRDPRRRHREPYGRRSARPSAPPSRTRSTRCAMHGRREASHGARSETASSIPGVMA